MADHARLAWEIYQSTTKGQGTMEEFIWDLLTLVKVDDLHWEDAQGELWALRLAHEAYYDESQFEPDEWDDKPFLPWAS
ncbi:hypothetical protein OHS59_16280 [Streptomyces sp. NBC_00414]|uniref:hypothetical protein n=1 Tax=Streptomyces sp. NBC_00414 TaxID=2975739 RepID=UPI002E202249